MKKYLLLSIFLFLTLILPVKALESDLVDFNKKGSIQITLENESNKIEGMELSLYSIATVTSKENNLFFEYKEELNNCEVSLNNLEDNNIVNELSKCIKDKSSVKKISNELGVVEFNNLDLGLYLIKQESKKEGYSTIDPFLVILPTIENDTWNYFVKATPKTEIYELINIKVNKVWNSKKEKLPENVTITLYKEKELIDTIILNKDNNWTHTWKDLEKSDNYHVVEINIPKDYTASYKQNNYTFTVTNTDTLPNTGQLYYSIIIFATLGFLFLLIGFVQIKKGKYNE